MASDAELEVYKLLRESQNKYTYFLLAAVGAGVGFALNQTLGANFSLSKFPLAIAIILWGVSFFSGTRHIAYVNSILYSNVELLRIQSGRHAEVGSHEGRIAAASGGILQAIEANVDKAEIFGYWQFRFLVAGTAFYIFWHMLMMFLRTIEG